MSTKPQKILTLSCAPAAARMRLYRQRRRRGIHRVPVEVYETYIDALIEKGYLDKASRYDRDALSFAVGSFVDDMLNGIV